MTPAQHARWEFEKGVADALMELTDKQIGDDSRPTRRNCQWCRSLRPWVNGARLCRDCDCPSIGSQA